MASFHRSSPRTFQAFAALAWCWAWRRSILARPKSYRARWAKSAAPRKQTAPKKTISPQQRVTRELKSILSSERNRPLGIPSGRFSTSDSSCYEDGPDEARLLVPVSPTLHVAVPRRGIGRVEVSQRCDDSVQVPYLSCGVILLRLKFTRSERVQPLELFVPRLLRLVTYMTFESLFSVFSERSGGR
jgi:hypothetical protein